MPIYQGNKQTNVIYQVSISGCGIYKKNQLTGIRQLQDLQSQLAESRREITQLKSLLHDKGAPNTPPSEALRIRATHLQCEVPQASPFLSRFANVPKTIRIYSRGVFKVPPMYREIGLPPIFSSQEIQLPPRATANQILSQYYNFTYVHRPLIDWHDFIRKVEQSYETGTFQGQNQLWVAMFFGCLALGTLYSSSHDEGSLHPDKAGLQYLVYASRLLNTWTDNLCHDHARTSLMIAMFLSEQNIQSAGWIWLGSGVRIAQDVGLHQESRSFPQAEIDKRRMTYWAITSYDR